MCPFNSSPSRDSLCHSARSHAGGCHLPAPSPPPCPPPPRTPPAPSGKKANPAQRSSAAPPSRKGHMFKMAGGHVTRGRPASGSRGDRAEVKRDAISVVAVSRCLRCLTVIILLLLFLGLASRPAPIMGGGGGRRVSGRGRLRRRGDAGRPPRQGDPLHPLSCGAPVTGRPLPLAGGGEPGQGGGARPGSRGGIWPPRGARVGSGNPHSPRDRSANWASGGAAGRGRTGAAREL